MLITPEMVRSLREEALRWDAAELALVVTACDEALADEGQSMATQICVDALDQWRATSSEVLTMNQVEDLWRAAVGARDWHASKICSTAAYPLRLCWTPNQVEIAAMSTCVQAWNARAVRLRAAGELPWPPRKKT